MIGKLRGKVDESTEDSVILDVGGVGYIVFCSGRTLTALPGRGQAAELVIETHVREDHIHLYGFATAQERDWFRLLTSVQGVGAKMAQAILGTFDPDTLTRMIGAQDKTGMTRAKSVGPKVAERIVTELKTKVAKMGHIAMPAHSGAVESIAAAKGKGKTKGAAKTMGDRRMEDAISALVNLGYNRTEAFTAVATVLQDQADAPLDAIIRAGLKELAR